MTDQSLIIPTPAAPSIHQAMWRRRHLEILALAAIVILLSFALRVQQDRIAFWFAPHWQFPQLCASRAWFGITCPGCGLTRSFVYLAQGRFHAAYLCHRLGWLVALVVVLQIPYRLVALKFGSFITAKESQWLTYGMVFALVANWLLQRFSY